MDLDATLYCIFVTIADELSFTRASALLNVSQTDTVATDSRIRTPAWLRMVLRTSRRVELTVEERSES
jgi:DNA-binding transcriptional LysR family regulator